MTRTPVKKGNPSSFDLIPFLLTTRSGVPYSLLNRDHFDFGLFDLKTLLPQLFWTFVSLTGSNTDLEKTKNEMKGVIDTLYMGIPILIMD